MIEIDGEFFEDLVEGEYNRKNLELLKLSVQVDLLLTQILMISATPIFPKFATGGVILTNNVGDYMAGEERIKPVR